MHNFLIENIESRHFKEPAVAVRQLHRERMQGIQQQPQNSKAEVNETTVVVLVQVRQVKLDLVGTNMEGAALLDTTRKRDFLFRRTPCVVRSPNVERTGPLRFRLLPFGGLQEDPLREN